MDKLSRKNLTGAALVLVAVLFAITAGGTALAQHHDDHGDTGHDTGQTTEHVEQAATHDDPHADPHAAHDADSEHGEHGEHGEGHGNMPHLKNFIGWIAPALPDNVAHQLEAFVDPIFSLLVVLLLSLFFISLRKQLSARTPNRTQMAAELLLGGLYGLFQQIIGPSARRYTPFLGSLFLFILANNLIGMLPLSHSSTASFNTTTLALGVLTFLYVQGIALKENGIGGYLHHMAGSPKTAMDWGFSLLLFPLHLLGELIKPISLSLRLFGNIFGEHTLVATMVILGGGVMVGLTGSDYIPGLPLQFPFYFLGLLSSTIQALVFTLLATVYIALWLPHGDHGEEHGH